METATLIVGALLGALAALGASRLMAMLRPKPAPEEARNEETTPTPLPPAPPYVPPDFLGEADARADEVRARVPDRAGDARHVEDFLTRARADEELGEDL